MARAPWGTAVHWARAEIDLEPVKPPEGSGITAADLAGALDDGVRAWNGALTGCAAPRLRVVDVLPFGAAKDDGHNRVVVKAGAWCPDGSGDRDDCYDPTRQAKTSLRLRRDTSARDGEIREADLEINAVHFRWSREGEAPATRSLRALVAHELGHVLGLDHACATPEGRGDGAAAACPVPAPHSIMYPDPTEPGRSTVLAPTPDAVQTLCSVR